MVEWGVDFQGSPDDLIRALQRAAQGQRFFERSTTIDFATGERVKPAGYGISFPTRRKEFLAELVYLELRAFSSADPHHLRRVEEVRKVYREVERILEDDGDEDSGNSRVILGPKPVPRTPQDAIDWPPPSGH